MFKRFDLHHIVLPTIGLAGLLTALGFGAAAAPRATQAAAGRPARPPADPALAWADGRAGGRRGITVANVDGSNAAVVYNQSFILLPAWSPDGAHLVFRDENFDLARIDISIVNGVPTGSNKTVLVTGTIGTEPQWSPAGDEIAYMTGYGPDNSLAAIPAGGGDPTILYTPPSGSAVEYPTWSADASRIAFREYVPGVPQQLIRIIDRATLDVTTAYESTYPIYRLDWARTQDVLAFELDDPAAGRKIVTLSLTPGSTPQVLIADGYWPSWSPDDSKLAYAVAGNQIHVYVYDFATQQSQSIGAGRAPEWRRF